MLILSRRLGEEVVLYTKEGTITVKFLEFQGGKIRLGFEAPGSIAILRKEIIGQYSRTEGGAHAQRTETDSQEPPDPDLQV